MKWIELWEESYWREMLFLRKKETSMSHRHRKKNEHVEWRCGRDGQLIQCRQSDWFIHPASVATFLLVKVLEFGSHTENTVCEVEIHSGSSVSPLLQYQGTTYPGAIYCSPNTYQHVWRMGRNWRAQEKSNADMGSASGPTQGTLELWVFNDTSSATLDCPFSLT